MNYTGRQLREISFPLGGIGTGSIGLSGSGRLIDWEIFNHANKGSTCSHVWNYAYALCFLFPELERSIRDLEFAYNTYETGEMDFRLKLPLGRRKGKFRACVDGQMGSIIKTFREWKLSGDTDWLRKNWPVLRNILFYAWSPENEDHWDRNRGRRAGGPPASHPGHGAVRPLLLAGGLWKRNPRRHEWPSWKRQREQEE